MKRGQHLCKKCTSPITISYQLDISSYLDDNGCDSFTQASEYVIGFDFPPSPTKTDIVNYKDKIEHYMDCQMDFTRIVCKMSYQLCKNFDALLPNSFCAVARNWNSVEPKFPIYGKSSR